MSCLPCDFQSKQTTKNEIKPNTNSYLCLLEKRQASVSMFMWKGKKVAFSLYSLHIFLLFTKKNSISLRAIQKYKRSCISQMHGLYSI